VCGVYSSHIRHVEHAKEFIMTSQYYDQEDAPADDDNEQYHCPDCGIEMVRSSEEPWMSKTAYGVALSFEAGSPSCPWCPKLPMYDEEARGYCD
jgi:hypothetical protein